MTRARSATPRRYLALWFPFLSADRWRRQQTQSRSAVSAEPRVFAERSGNALRIGAVDDAAHRLGLRPGLPLADARARFGGLDVAEMDRDADRALLRFLAKACLRYSPGVALDRDDALTLDITGCAHLFGGEMAMLDEILARLHGWGMTPRGAIAGTVEAAQAIACYGQGGVVEGREAQTASVFPVAALRLAEDVALKLNHLGLKTVGALAARPRKPLAARFGRDLLERLDRLRGLIDVPPSTLRPLPLFRAERRFAEPIARTSDIDQALADLSHAVVRQLELEGEGGRLFEARFFRSDGLQRAVVARTSAATRNPAQIRRLFSERLGALDDPLSAGFGFDLIRLTVRRSERLGAAQAALGGSAVQAAKIAETIDQLAARLGETHVLRLSPIDSHDPARASNLVSALQSTAKQDWPDAQDLPPRALTLFEPPQPILDVMAGLPDGPPRQFRWRRRLYRIDTRDGAERISTEWWRALDEVQPPAPKTEEEAEALAQRRAEARRLTQDRDYFQVEDSEGHRYWLYRQGKYGDPSESPRWFLHGLLP